jgi:hypothetical protein
MNADDFVEAINTEVYESATKAVMSLLSDGPPGRRPRARLVELSTWFAELAEPDRARLEGVVRLAAYSLSSPSWPHLTGIKRSMMSMLTLSSYRNGRIPE